MTDTTQTEIERLAEVIAVEIMEQGNEIDNLGDGESICLLSPLPTINLNQLVAKLIREIGGKH